MIAVVVLVFSFQSSSALGYAYGMAVTGTITITTLLFFYIARQHWRTPLWILVPGAAFLLTVDLLFFAANLTKFTHGAWLPLAVALVFFTVLTTWQKGRAARHRRREAEEGPLRSLRRRAARPAVRRSSASPAPRSSSTAAKETTPLAMRATVEHNQVLPRERRSSLRSRRSRFRTSRPSERIQVDDLGYRDDGISSCARGSATWTSRTSRRCPADRAGRPRAAARAGRPLVLPLDDRAPRAATIPGCAAGASISSWRRRRSRRTPPSISACRATRP